MRFILCGAGAVGSLIGGYLHKSGEDVILVCSKRHAEAINKAGLRIRGIQGSFLLKIPVVSDINDVDLKNDDIILFTMKSYDLETAVEKIRTLTSHLRAVCFQNGLRSEEIVMRRFKRVYGGVVFLNAKFLEPGTILLFNSLKLTHLTLTVIFIRLIFISLNNSQKKLFHVSNICFILSYRK